MPGVIPVEAIFQAILTVVDGMCCAGNIVSILFWHMVLPEPGCDSLSVGAIRSEGGVGCQVEIESFAGNSIVVLASQLRVAATAIKIAISCIVVAHALAVHQTAQLPRPAFQRLLTGILQCLCAFAPCGANGNLMDATCVSEAFLKKSEPCRLVAHLRHEVGHLLARRNACVTSRSQHRYFMFTRHRRDPCRNGSRSGKCVGGIVFLREGRHGYFAKFCGRQSLLRGCAIRAVEAAVYDTRH